MKTDIGQQIVLHEEIGKGGFGSVFKCGDENSNIFVAKVCEMSGKHGLPSPMELSIMSSIRHPYLNECLKIHSTDKKIYIFQNLALSDLSKLVRKDKTDPSYYKPTSADLRRWLSSIVLALKYLHNNEIVHADIKASNILVFEDNKEKIAKLADFTVSQKMPKHNHKFVHTVCTSTHRPLENFLKKGWDYSLDIWCLGVTIYEVVYGNLLFPYQGNLGKRKNESGKKIKEFLDERCINCILDWADNGPRKQEHNYNNNYTTYKYHHFDLAAEFYNDRFKINDILLKMLSIDPSARPTVHEILKHPFFSGIVDVDYKDYDLSHHINSISTHRQKRISKLCAKYNFSELMVENIICLYASYDNGGQSKLLKLYACILICCKLYRVSLPNLEADASRLFGMEKDICNNLEFKLHL